MKLEALDHPKTLDLASRLGVERPTAIGYLELLWAFVGGKAAQGNIGKWPDGSIAEACFWRGKPEVFITALVDAGLLDRHPIHRLLVHDWHDHAQAWVRLKLKKQKLPFLTITAVRTVVATAMASDIDTLDLMAEGTPEHPPDRMPDGTTELLLNGSVDNTVEASSSARVRPSLAKPSLAKPSQVSIARMRESDKRDWISLTPEQAQQLQSTYPRGIYRESEWLVAEKLINQHLANGVEFERILASMERYAAQQRAMENIGTRFVLSPVKHCSLELPQFDEPFPLPKTKAEVRQDANVDAGLAWLARSESPNATG